MINFTVKSESGVPIYEQLIYAVKKGIVNKQLKPGDKFPSVREMSREFKINPNTALKVVNHLVNEKLLIVKPGIGTVICASSVSDPEAKKKILSDDVERMVVKAKQVNIEKTELMDAIEQYWNNQ